MKILLTILTIGTLSLPTSCDEETRYQVLSFFFDGVPPPGSDQPVVTVVDTTTDSTGVRRQMRQPRIPQTTLYLHKPYKEKRCDDCHKSGFGNKLAESRVDILCKTCHEKFQERRLYTHGPVAVGQCLVCHNPHKTSNEHLLIRAGQELCTYCHEAIDRETIPEHQLTADQKCESCHSPHFSNISKRYIRSNGSGNS